MLTEYINLFESSKYQLAKTWANSEHVQIILTNKLIEHSKFETFYAIGVIEYFIGVLKKEKMLGNCPVMHQMLHEFSKANLSSEDVFMICANFKRTLINFAFAQNFSTQENIDQINYMLDENFRGVIKIYDELIHAHTKELESQYQLFKEYTNAIDVSTIISKADTNGCITYVNKAFEEISGYSSQELIGKPHNIVRHPDMPSSFFENMWKTLKNKNVFFGIIKNRHKNGSDYYVKSYILPILDLDNETIEYISIRQDITELMHTLEREHKLNILKDDFLRNISHEIKTPLNIILGTSSLISKKLKDPSFDKLFRMIDDSSSRLQKIVDSSVELSQFTSGHYEKNMVFENLFLKFTQLLKEKSGEAALKNINFKYQIDTFFDQRIECEFSLMEKAFTQIIDNAIEFTPNSGDVAINIIYDQNSIVFIAIDSGLGMERNDIKHIFEPFYQIDSSLTRQHEGLGIGLALTKEIVDLLNGTIEVESQPSKGTLFTITIPLIQKPI